MGMAKRRYSFKCGVCGGGDLRLTGFEMLSVAVVFDAVFGTAAPTSTDWNVDYTEPRDGPRAFVVCDHCCKEVEVACRNEATKRSVTLSPAEIYQFLWGSLALHGIVNEGFKGQVEVEWKKFLKKLTGEHPELK